MQIKGAMIKSIPKDKLGIFTPTPVLNWCEIEGGKIEADDGIWFIGCAMKKTNRPEILGEQPPNPVPIIQNTNIIKTKLPAGYYSMCVFL